MRPLSKPASIVNEPFRLALLTQQVDVACNDHDQQISVLEDSLMNTDRLTGATGTARYEGGDDGADEDVDNIDFNNYKGIYADEDAGQKYTCPTTGAHFEPRDLCKRIYKVIDKRMPLQYELYG